MNIQGEKQHNLPTKKNVEITNLQLKVLIIFMKKKKKRKRGHGPLNAP